MTKPLLASTRWVMETAEDAWAVLEADCEDVPSDADEIAARELETLLEA